MRQFFSSVLSEGLAVGIGVLLVVGSVSCASVKENEPLKKWDPNTGYRFTSQSVSKVGSDHTIFSVAFSGGGARAAAFGYGVLEELADTEVTVEGQSHRLLDEVDGVNGVSGGSFTAAYFALHGDRIFQDFESRFLKYNIERDLILRLINPWYWGKLLSPNYSRTDLAVEYYDEHIFDGATFGTLEAGNGPLLRINATDLSTGNPFRFEQTQFDFICSDLSSFPIARAVGASAALPIVFPPITLQNYAGTCEFEMPVWLEKTLKEARQTSIRQWRYARVLESYLDQENRPYIHLIDGGISDNLAVRNPMRLAMGLHAWHTQVEAQDSELQRFIGIVVNSQTESKLTWRFVDQDPSVSALLASMTNAQIDVLSAETISYLKTLWALFQEQASAAGLPTKFYLIEVSFQAAEEKAERQYLNSLPTSLSLPEEDVDHLRQSARQILRNDPEFQRLLRDLSE
jgi:NTE family protein